MRVLTACSDLAAVPLGPDDQAVLLEASRAASATVAPLLAEAVLTLAATATGLQPDADTRHAVETAVAAEPTVDAGLEALDGQSYAAVAAFTRGFRHGRGRCGVVPVDNAPMVTVTFEQIVTLAHIPDDMIEHADKLERVRLRVG